MGWGGPIGGFSQLLALSKIPRDNELFEIFVAAIFLNIACSREEEFIRYDQGYVDADLVSLGVLELPNRLAMIWLPLFINIFFFSTPQ